MKALEISKHKTNLTNILIDIYKDDLLSPILGFKGGTAAMLFYNLPRFSVDLDFDLLVDYSEDSKGIEAFVTKMHKVLSAKYLIKDQSEKFNTLFWLVSYGSGLTNIKVEVSTRDNPYNHYDLKQYYGMKFNVMDIGDMIAHKMIALVERSSFANRDLFDVHYFLGTPYVNDINYDIIEDRIGKTPKKFYEFLFGFIDDIDPKSVLGGLGELLTESQKDWAKAKLVEETKVLIRRQIDLM